MRQPIAFLSTKHIIMLLVDMPDKEISKLFAKTYDMMYDFNFDNIVAIGSDDLGSWDVTKEEFLGQTSEWRKYGVSPINTSWQWSNKNKCFFESGLHSTLYLPTTVEKEAIANDVSYTEIYLYNKDKPIKPIKCFYTEDATKEEINLITELAKEQNLPLEEIYIGNERKRKK